ncbi:MAG: hypothetical protein NTZ10_03090 [Candidatus Saganbacteria bacterium]|nr:hypothetical protein [Candidatus Saganbacteria bacterium]
MKVSIKKIFIVLFFLSYLFYVLSSAFYLKAHFQWLYLAKHIMIAMICVVGMFTFSKVINKRHLLLFMVFLPVFIPFLFFNWTGWVMAFQNIIFFAAAVIISKYWTKRDTFSIIILFLAVSMIPVFIDLLFNAAGFIYNTWYGRPRLLLGYFHPKEASIALLIPILLARFFITDKKIKYQFVIFFDLPVLVLLYFVSSRNTLFFYANFLLLSFLLKRIKFVPTIILYGLTYIGIPLLFLAQYYEEINLWLSKRLSIWMTGNISFFGSGMAMASIAEYGVFSKFRIDNFYLDYLIENGVIPFVFLITVLFLIILKLRSTKIRGVYVNAVYIPFLISCVFDSGMFSSGNFLNLFVWSFVAAGLCFKSESFDTVKNETAGPG